MPEEKCPHIKRCDYCSDVLAAAKPTFSEPISILQQAMATLERKKLEAVSATSNYNRMQIAIEKSLKDAKAGMERAEEGLEQARRHLEAELRKFDPALSVSQAEEVARA